MNIPNGTFVWYELMTSDAAAATSFYCALLGWTAREAGVQPDQSYTVLNAGATGVGGLMTLPEEARVKGARPGWIGYLAVDDVDAYVARVTQAGGMLHRAPDDIPGVGRFAVVADPQGAAFVLFKGMGEHPGFAAPGTPGHIGWRELHAANGPSAFDFYAALFGWTKDQAVDMGPMGVYQLFATGGGTAAGDTAVGGMMTKADAIPRPFWLYYFNVADIEVAAESVKSAGGQVLNGPHEVPGGSWIVQCSDPQGAMFALLGRHA
jgi:predicted enzyme related to lactoylglutathione lyase